MNRPTCPVCGGHTFVVYALQDVRVKFHKEIDGVLGCQEDGDHTVEAIDGDLEFDGHSDARCDNCNYQGLLGNMVTKQKESNA